MTNQTELIREVRAALEAYKVGATGATTNIFMNTPTWLQQLTDRLEVAERQREEAVKALEAIARDTVDDITEDYARATLKRIKGENG